MLLRNRKIKYLHLDDERVRRRSRYLWNFSNRWSSQSSLGKSPIVKGEPKVWRKLSRFSENLYKQTMILVKRIVSTV